VISDIRIRVLVRREHDDPDIHALFKYQVYATEGSHDACLVAIIQYCDILGKTLDKPDLVSGKGSPGAGNHILKAGLIHRNNISISLNQITFVLPDYFRL